MLVVKSRVSQTLQRASINQLRIDGPFSDEIKEAPTSPSLVSPSGVFSPTATFNQPKPSAPTPSVGQSPVATIASISTYASSSPGAVNGRLRIGKMTWGVFPSLEDNETKE